MRRGLLAVGGARGDHAGRWDDRRNDRRVRRPWRPAAGLWSKRGSIVALGELDRFPLRTRTPAPINRSTCASMLGRLAARYGLPVEERHLTGFYRRYSGDLAELGKGEILAWTA